MALDINALLQAGESETVEFKAQWTDAVLETAAALANTRGGILLLGIDDKGQVVGLDVDEARLRTYANLLADSLRVQPSLQVWDVSGRHVLTVEVASARTPVSYRGPSISALATPRERLRRKRWDNCSSKNGTSPGIACRATFRWTRSTRTPCGVFLAWHGHACRRCPRTSRPRASCAS